MGHKRILYGLIILGLLAAMPGLYARIKAERSIPKVELVADGSAFASFAQSQGASLQSLVGQLHSVGVEGLSVSESSLSSLVASDQANSEQGAALLAQRNTAGQPALPFTVDPSGTYVFISQTTLGNWVAQSLGTVLFGQNIPFSVDRVGTETVIGLTEDANTILDVPLGFPPGAFALARTWKMDVVPRLEGPPWGMSASQLAALFARVTSAGVSVHTIVFAGTSLPGYPANLSTLEQLMKQHGYLVGVIETSSQLTNINQAGILPLTDALGPVTVRLYSVPSWLLDTVTSGDNRALLSLLSSVTERNMRILYLRPITVGPSPVTATLQFYSDLAKLLQSRGYPLGFPEGFPIVQVHTYARVVENLAVVAAGLLLLEALFPGIERYGYQPLAVLGVLAILVSVASHHLSVLAGAFFAALVFAGLALVWLAHRWQDWESERMPSFGRLWLRSAGASLVMAGIAFAGAVLISALLGSTPFLLAWEYYRGVKLTFLAIPAVAVVAFIVFQGLRPVGPTVRNLWSEIGWLGEESIKFKYVAVFVVLAAIGGYYLLRSGNVSASLVPGIELAERDFMTRIFTYRPLEKEFLVGYPSIFAAVLFSARRQKWLFGLFLVGASVGMVSIMDAFATLRTPFVHTLLRESSGWLVGMVTASVFLVVLYLICLLWDRRPRISAPDRNR